MESLSMKNEFFALILKYVVKRFNLSMSSSISEDTSEDVRFNYEFVLDSFTKNGQLIYHKTDITLLDPKLVKREDQLMQMISAVTLNYPINKTLRYQSGAPVRLQDLCVQHRNNVTDFFLFCYSVYICKFNKSDELLLPMLIMTKLRTPTKMSEKATKYYNNNYSKNPTFLEPLVNNVRTWLKC